MSKPGVRLDDDVYTYLFNHRTTKEKTMSEVIRGLIALKEGSGRVSKSDRYPGL